MSPLTGYGRGWREPKAKTLVGRFMQKMREPADKATYIMMLWISFTILAFVIG